MKPRLQMAVSAPPLFRVTPLNGPLIRHRWVTIHGSLLRVVDCNSSETLKRAVLAHLEAR